MKGFVVVPVFLDEASDPFPKGVMFAPVPAALLSMFSSLGALVEGTF